MEQTIFIDLVQKTLTVIIELSAPVLGVSLGVGILISLFQAVTQIQEATLTFVPKIIACLVTLGILGPWMLSIYTDFVRDLYENINAFL